jgi:hypothetical protein
LFDARSLRVLDPLLGRVGVEQAPADCPGEDLAERLGRLETMSAWHRYPPRGDLGWSELADRKILEESSRLGRQPPALLDRLWLGVVLGEIRLDQFAERRALGQALLLPKPIERAFKRLGGRLLGWEAAALDRFDPRPPTRYR